MDVQVGAANTTSLDLDLMVAKHRFSPNDAGQSLLDHDSMTALTMTSFSRRAGRGICTMAKDSGFSYLLGTRQPAED